MGQRFEDCYYRLSEHSSIMKSTLGGDLEMRMT